MPWEIWVLARAALPQAWVPQGWRRAEQPPKLRTLVRVLTLQLCHQLQVPARHLPPRSRSRYRVIVATDENRCWPGIVDAVPMFRLLRPRHGLHLYGGAFRDCTARNIDHQLLDTWRIICLSDAGDDNAYLPLRLPFTVISCVAMGRWLREQQEINTAL